MRGRRLGVVAVVALVAAAVGIAAALGVFTPDDQRARDSVERLMESYVVPTESDEGDDEKSSLWPASDYGDVATMEKLATYGVDTEQWRRHSLEHMDFEVGEVTVDDDAATVSVTITNASLSAAVDAAGSDFAAFLETQEATDLYAQSGKAALFARLVDSVYAHLDADQTPVTTTVAVACSKSEDGSWTPDVTGDVAFFSALYGGSDVIGGLAAH